MSRRLGPAAAVCMVALLGAMALDVHRFGSGPLLAMGAGALGAALAWLYFPHTTSLRRTLLCGWLSLQAAATVAVLVATGPRLYLLPLFLFPALFVNALFSGRLARVTVLATVVLLAGLTALAATSWGTNTAFAFIYPAATLLATSFGAAAARNLDAAVRQMAVVDALTGLPNRVALQSRLAELELQAPLRRQPVTLLAGDLDHFKAINDARGHAHGDLVLAQVAKRLVESLGRDGVAYRLGGEEFVVVLSGTIPTDGSRIAERLRDDLSREPIAGEHVTISFGVAGSADGAFRTDELLGFADRALYTSKADGRNRTTLIAPLAVVPTAAPVTVPGAKVRHVAAASTDLAGGARSVVDDGRAAERAHLIELSRNLQKANEQTYGFAFPPILAGAFFFGWLTIVPSLIASVLYEIAERGAERWRRPEVVLGAAWLLTVAAYGTSTAFVHFSSASPPLYVLPMLMILPTCTAAGIPPRAAPFAVSWAVLVAVGAGVLVNPSFAFANPGVLALAGVLVATGGIVGVITGASALAHRGATVVDPLTGMLNRRALRDRANQLAQQTAITPQSIAVIALDLDHFKAINDVHGHAAGDEVLRRLSTAIHSELRATDSVYRIGGEEFIVLVPGASADDAMSVAERIRLAAAAMSAGSMVVSISAGVAASGDGPFDFDAVFAQADRALYAAKGAGRDCVHGAAMRALAA